MDREALYRRALGLPLRPALVDEAFGGSWIYLDGGTLELGIVRDSTLTSGNDFQVFDEMFWSDAVIITSGDSA